MVYVRNTLALLILAGVQLGSSHCYGQQSLSQDPQASRSDPVSVRIDRRSTIKRDDWFVRPWIMAAPAFAIADNLYYVGNQWFASHLVVGTKGMVLIDTPHKEHTYLLLESIRSLGFDPADITLVLHTHYHTDHTGCTRRIKELSGAKVGVGAQDVGKLKTHSSMRFALEFWNARSPYFETFDVEHPLRNGDKFDLGNIVIQCHHTPGHTPGTMSYSMDVTIDGRRQKAFLFGGPGLNFLKVDKMYYRGAKDDFARTLDYLESLDVDVWLGAHPFVNNTLRKYERVLQGEKPSPFIDRDGWDRFLRIKRKDFEKLVAEKAEKLAEIDNAK